MKIYGLLGRDIDYSFSRGYFKEKFENEKIHWASYVNFDLPSLLHFKEVLLTEGLAGMNVTIPYKEEIIPYLDQLDPVAAAIGAVNTIAIGSDGLTGYNTDAYGFETSLRSLWKEDAKEHKALVLGSGGASKAVNYVLERMGFLVQRVSRNKEKTGMSYADLSPDRLSTYRLIVNTTPLGTHPNTEQKPELHYEGIHRDQLGFDLIYNPGRTAFLKEFESRGCLVLNGLSMLEHQAEKAWEIWQSHTLL